MQALGGETLDRSFKTVTYVKQAAQFAQRRPKTSLAILAGAGIIFVPRLTALGALGVGAAYLLVKRTSEETRKLFRDRGLGWLQKAKQLMPEKVVVVPTIPMDQRPHTAPS